MERFFVRATSVNQVRRALDRAPGGAQVIGRYDRDLIECGHTMSNQSYSRHWPILLSRFEKAGIDVVDAPTSQNAATFGTTETMEESNDEQNY